MTEATRAIATSRKPFCHRTETSGDRVPSGGGTCHTSGVATSVDPDRDLVPEERRRLILEVLRERRSITIGAVEQQFSVSPMTARRDLVILVREGHARRTHGGAVLPDLAAH